jgi:anti-sigma B factor antagonist
MMQITDTARGDVLVCKVDGEINIDTSPQLRKTFGEYIGKNNKKIVIDFSGLTYIDSSGIATFIELFQRLKKIEGKFRICAMSPKVKSVFEVTKVLKLFEVFNSQEEALKDF